MASQLALGYLTVWSRPQLLLEGREFVHIRPRFRLLPARPFFEDYWVEKRREREPFPIFADSETLVIVLLDGAELVAF